MHLSPSHYALMHSQAAHVEEGSGADGVAHVTFLYTYKAGACPKSYGMNVAKLAKLPMATILRAKQKSEEFEAAVLVRSRTHKPVESACRIASRTCSRPYPTDPTLSLYPRAALLQSAERAAGALDRSDPVASYRTAQRLSAGGGDDDDDALTKVIEAACAAPA